MTQERVHVGGEALAPDNGLSSVGGTAARIEQAAMEMFFERGYSSTSMRDIAQEVGITAAALYNHFASKDQILYAILKRVHDGLIRDLAEADASAGGDPRDRLAALARVHALWHTHHRKDARVANAEIYFLAEPGRSEISAARMRGRKLFEQAIADGISRGVFREVDVFVATVAILNMGIHIADWFSPDGRLSAEEVADVHADLALRMVGARARRKGNGARKGRR